MKFLSTLLALVAFVQFSSAWVLFLEGNGEDSTGGLIEQTFYSREADNDCYNLSSRFYDEGVASFNFCTRQMYGCQITFFDDTGCRGKNLGNNGGRGYNWVKPDVSKAGSKMKSFRITGCRGDDIPILSKFKFDVFRLADC